MKLIQSRFYHRSKQYKRYLVRQAKSKPCVDCLAEGRRADWPWSAMTLDHTGPKTMDFGWGGGTYLRMKSGMVGAKRPYIAFPAHEIIRELATCDPVCAGHHNIRTRIRKLEVCPDEDEDEDQNENDDEDEDEIALF